MAENLPHCIPVEWTEGDDAINAIDEFLSEGLLDGFMNFAGLVGRVFALGEAHCSSVGILGSEVGGQDDDGIP